ncbi:hypothetical protein LT40_08725 [Pseudomonas rhizosphaerae]|uniref:Uncharacterized protein n=1 Tax=Pseudomonas rhizosphaerae TaxID=216142 RepID=A0A089YPH9_9PSED|nr:hypothetical protein [Pseudomonas rhizosphaerae]AIS17479.1 hypothetical protein LT40_08725 [Pseudomonas rhizosphaerae]
MVKDIEKAVRHAKAAFDDMTQEELDEWNLINDKEHREQYQDFIDGYKQETCYLCGKDFKTVSRDDPCVHWLLRRGKFRTKDIKLVTAKFGYHNICAYLRWCANAERIAVNINDLTEEAPAGKVLSSTIKWKNIEWSFDCSPNDFAGHGGAHSNFPHYHFQMRIDGRQFINFNDYHLPFSDFDLVQMRLSQEPGVHSDYGAHGFGMQDAMHADPADIINYTNPTDDESDSVFNIQTMVMAPDNPIRGEEIIAAFEESKRTGRTMAAIFRERFAGSSVQVQTVVSPSDNVPQITSRTEHKPR